MMEFILKFKYKNGKEYWCTKIYADNIDEAIKEAERFTLRKDEGIEKVSLNKVIYRHQKIKEWN